MKRTSLVSAMMVAALAAGAWAAEPATRSAGQPTTQPAPRVEVAFVLDTTGSMSGLIAAAKAKIWSIANQVVQGKPKPTVRMALVAYRDKGDEYVTKVFDLTDNIDQVYTDLMGFAAGGGGDTPESVNQALFDAVTKLAWSQDGKTLKIIYLVVYSPPHNEYTDTPTYDKIAKSAIEKGIYINTVLCGNNQETAKVWREISDRSEGVYLAIDAGGGAIEVATPFDADLAKLNAELVSTAVVYGSKEAQAAQTRLNAGAARYTPTAAADRAAFADKTGRAASNDLVEEVAKGRVDLAKLKDAELPDNLQKMTPEDRKKYLSEQQAKREGVLKRIGELTTQRSDFIKKELAKNDKAKDSFDARVVETLKAQAGKFDISYK